MLKSYRYEFSIYIRHDGNETPDGRPGSQLLYRCEETVSEEVDMVI